MEPRSVMPDFHKDRFTPRAIPKGENPGTARRVKMFSVQASVFS